MNTQTFTSQILAILWYSISEICRVSPRQILPKFKSNCLQIYSLRNECLPSFVHFLHLLVMPSNAFCIIPSLSASHQLTDHLKIAEISLVNFECYLVFNLKRVYLTQISWISIVFLSLRKSVQKKRNFENYKKVFILLLIIRRCFFVTPIGTLHLL